MQKVYQLLKLKMLILLEENAHLDANSPKINILPDINLKTQELIKIINKYLAKVDIDEEAEKSILLESMNIEEKLLRSSEFNNEWIDIYIKK